MSFSKQNCGMILEMILNHDFVFPKNKQNQNGFISQKSKIKINIFLFFRKNQNHNQTNIKIKIMILE